MVPSSYTLRSYLRTASLRVNILQAIKMHAIVINSPWATLIDWGSKNWGMYSAKPTASGIPVQEKATWSPDGNREQDSPGCKKEESRYKERNCLPQSDRIYNGK